MRKFSRSLLWAGLVAAGVAACGDDVTITPPPPPPPPPTPTVHSISVAPSGVTLNHPTTQQMTAAVNADAGVATTVTWSAAPASVATISATGLLTTVGAGNVAVQACSTVVSAVCGVATITVSTNPQTVTGVAVTPANASITRPATGSTTLQLSAAVSGANNPSQTVTWSVATSGLGTTVTVSTTGLVTVTSAAAGGTVNISACSTVTGFTNVCGFSALTISIPAPTTISIQAITTGATFIPVNINNVAGQIEFSLNLDPGANSVAGVDVLIDGVVAASQNFSALQWETARAKAIAEGPDADVTIILSVNTAVYDCIAAGSTTCLGVNSYDNGARQVSARARLANLAPVATPTQTLIFNNTNGVHVCGSTTCTVAGQTTNFTTGTTANAQSLAGLRYDRGALTVMLVPVTYGANQTTQINAGVPNLAVTFGNPGCDAAGIGPRTVNVAAASGPPFTATFSQTATAGAGNVTNYEFNGCAAFNAIGESFSFAGVDNNGDALLPPGSTALNINAITSLRLDNRAPGAPTFVANPNFRQNGWINAGSATNPIAMTGLNTSATSNGWLANTAAAGTGCAGGTGDCGVGIGAAFAAPWYNRELSYGAGPTVAAAVAATPSGSPTAPAITLTNMDLCAVISATDALGNRSALPAAATACTAPPAASSTAVAAQHLLFGEDIDAPAIAFSGGVGANARLNGATPAGSVANAFGGTGPGAPAGEFQVTVVDNGTLGNSGMQTGRAVMGTVQIQNAAGLVCFIGTGSVGPIPPAACARVSINAAPPFPLVPTTTVGASTIVGYYFYRAFAQDAAGNQSADVTRVFAFDPGANVPGLTTSIFNIPLTGNSVTFNANASDNFDLWRDQYSLRYAAGGLPGNLDILYPLVILNSFPASTITPGTFVLVNSNVSAAFTTSSFMRQVEQVTGNSPLTLGAAAKPDQLTGIVQDQASNLSTAAVTPITPAQVTTGTSYLPAAAGQLIDFFGISNGATSVSSNGANGCAAGTPTAATTVTLNADARGPTATFNPPFTRVDFYVQSNGFNRLIGSQTSPVTTDNGVPLNGRQHRYSFTWTPGGNLGGVLGKILGAADPANVCAGAQTLFAVGVNAAGDALVTPTTATITLVNP